MNQNTENQVALNMAAYAEARHYSFNMGGLERLKKTVNIFHMENLILKEDLMGNLSWLFTGLRGTALK